MESRVVSIRLDADLHERIKSLAEKERRPAAQQIVYLIERGLIRYEAEQGAIEAMDAVGQTNKEKIAK